MEENIEAMEVPEVETEVILIKQVSNEDVRVGKIASFLLFNATIFFTRRSLRAYLHEIRFFYCYFISLK